MRRSTEYLLKCVFLGDNISSDRTLLRAYYEFHNGRRLPFSTCYADFILFKKEYNGNTIKLQVLQPRFTINKHYISKSLQESNVVILTFPIHSRSAYDNISKVWYPLVKSQLPDVPIILLGTRAEFKDDLKRAINFYKKIGKFFVSHEDTDLIQSSQEYGENLAKKIGALKYMECSAVFHRAGLDAVFDQAIQAALSNLHKTSSTVNVETSEEIILNQSQEVSSAEPSVDSEDLDFFDRVDKTWKKVKQSREKLPEVSEAISVDGSETSEELDEAGRERKNITQSASLISQASRRYESRRERSKSLSTRSNDEMLPLSGMPQELSYEETEYRGIGTELSGSTSVEPFWFLRPQEHQREQRD